MIEVLLGGAIGLAVGFLIGFADASWGRAPLIKPMADEPVGGAPQHEADRHSHGAHDGAEQDCHRLTMTRGKESGQ